VFLANFLAIRAARYLHATMLGRLLRHGFGSSLGLRVGLGLIRPSGHLLVLTPQAGVCLGAILPCMVLCRLLISSRLGRS